MALADALKNVNFRMGEDGQIVAVREEPSTPQPEAQEHTPAVAVPQPAPAPQPQANTELAELKAQVSTLMTLLQGQKQVQQEDQTIELPEDAVINASDYNFLVDTFKGMIQKAFEPIQPILSDYSIQVQAQQLIADLEKQHPGEGGTRFQQALPVLQQIIDKAPELSLSAAYEIASQKIQNAPSPTQPEAQTSSGEVGDNSVDEIIGKVAEARERAEKTQVEKGVSASESAPANPRTVRDAVNQSIEEVFASKRS